MARKKKEDCVHPFEKLLEIDTKDLEKNDLEHHYLFNWFNREEAVVLNDVALRMEELDVAVVFRDMQEDSYYIAREFKHVVSFLRKTTREIKIMYQEVYQTGVTWLPKQLKGKKLSNFKLTDKKELKIFGGDGKEYLVEFHLRESIGGVSSRGPYVQFISQAVAENIQKKEYDEGHRYNEYLIRQELQGYMDTYSEGYASKIFRELINVLRIVELPPYKVYNSEAIDTHKEMVMTEFYELKKKVYELEMLAWNYTRMSDKLPETEAKLREFYRHLGYLEAKVKEGLHYIYNTKEVTTEFFNTKVSGFNVGISMLLEGMENIKYVEETVVLPSLEYSREKGSYYIPNYDFIVTDASGVTYAIEAGVGDTHESNLEKDIMKAEIAKEAGMIPVMITSNTNLKTMEEYYKNYTYVYDIVGEKYLGTKWRRNLQIKLENLIGETSKVPLDRVGIQSLMDKKDKTNREIAEDFGENTQINQ